MNPQPSRSPVLGRLNALVGAWGLTATIEGKQMAGGRTTFDWIEDGAFLRQRAEAEPATEEGVPSQWVENSPFPVVTIIGLDDSSETFSYVYSDARGVSRVYEMTIEDRVWRVWGQSGAEFFQRFEGVFGDDGDTISAHWDHSTDGSEWELDFELTYTRLT